MAQRAPWADALSSFKYDADMSKFNNLIALKITAQKIMDDLLLLNDQGV